MYTKFLCGYDICASGRIYPANISKVVKCSGPKIPGSSERQIWCNFFLRIKIRLPGYGSRNQPGSQRTRRTATHQRGTKEQQRSKVLQYIDKSELDPFI